MSFCIEATTSLKFSESGWLCFATRLSNHLFAHINAKQRSGIDVLLTLRGDE
ncbi:hypothetical protein [Methylomonas fluvii]|nr:hypothetical protein [Methylomonas fluvii]